MTFNSIDIAIVVILAIFGIIGFRRGLVKSIISLTSIIVGFIAAKLFYLQLSDYIATATNINSKINSFVYDKLMASFPNGQVSLTASDTSSSLQWVLTKLFHSQTIVNDTVSTISSQITVIVLNILSFVALFIATIIIIKIVGVLLNKISKLPVLSFVNKLGGSIIGIIKGGLLCILLVSAVSSLTIFTSNPTIVDLLSKSVLCQYFDISNWLF
jgi:uncharacterized membrane protein required for colicin V production